MTETPLAQRFADAMGQLLGPDFPSDIGLAVSGGGDSMAMLYLAHNWTRDYGVRLWVVTIDHGLRAESAAEAAMVSEECALLGWPHATLRWHWDGTGNVQDAARRARLALIDKWRGPVRHVLFAHTKDDQAETVLMRLMRGSGVDGLSGMRAARQVAPHALSVPPLAANDVSGTAPAHDARSPGFTVVRPCLDMHRDALRHYTRVLQGRWVEDPSNENLAFDRVRVRHLLKVLSEDGLTASVLADTGHRMARARDALQARLVGAVAEIGSDAPLGQVRLDRDGFAALDAETQLRLLTSALCYVGSAEYRPRAASSDALLDQVLSGRGGTLHGVDVIVEKAHLRFVREAAAVECSPSRLGALWDGQWVLRDQSGAMPGDAKVCALGQSGWCQIESKAPPLVPHRAALALPAVWLNDALLACPALGIGTNITARRYVLGRPDTGFEAFCLSH